MIGGGRAGELIVVADAHLEAHDPEMEPFLAFLKDAAGRAGSLVLLGDVFSLWLGAPKYTLEHHRQVLDACRRVREAGTEVVFVEGNREFDAAGWRGDAFDTVGQRWTVHDWAGRHWMLAHGDVIDPEDAGNRLFRAVVRSRAVLAAFRRLPSGFGLRIGHGIERRLRHRNLEHKTRIDEALLERYGRWLAGNRFDGGVIGHLHVELSREYRGGNGATHPLLVLPDWRTTHRYLRVDADGEARFESWGNAPVPWPAIVAVRESGSAAEIRLDRGDPPLPGEEVSVSGGHGSGARRGWVRRVDPQGSGWLTVELEPGPPLQVGDRVAASPAAAGRRSGGDP